MFVASDIGTIAQRPGNPVTIYVVGDLRAIGMRSCVSFKHAWITSPIGRTVKVLGYISNSSTQCGAARVILGTFEASPRGVLLKERFFRHGIYLAGELPVFWCTTPGSGVEKHNKTAVLADRTDFDEALSFVDLGLY